MEAVALIGMYGAMTISLAAAVMVTVAVLRMWFS